MGIYNIIERATDFGTLRSRDNFFSFTLKILIYIIPAVILGNYTDITIKRLQEYKAFGDNKIYYILLQTLIIVSTQFIFLTFLLNFINEFQVTIAGGYFIVLYFGMQTNYFHMIKEYINN
jgi:undecaprenyl pyrophosphate phosphatase UppP